VETVAGLTKEQELRRRELVSEGGLVFHPNKPGLLEYVAHAFAVLGIDSSRIESQQGHWWGIKAGESYIGLSVQPPEREPEFVANIITGSLAGEWRIIPSQRSVVLRRGQSPEWQPCDWPNGTKRRWHFVSQLAQSG
jgi:hypothetical protein